MGERKPSCHYIPHDFDPSKSIRRCKPQNGQHQVRFMLPFAIQCSNCGEYMFSGTKANCRKELCYTEFYLGEINVYRLYMHCKSCYAEITIKTDPKNLDYIVEKGATRHFEPWRNFQVQLAMEEKEKLMGTKLKQVELKTADMERDVNGLHELERLKAASNKQAGFVLEEIPDGMYQTDGGSSPQRSLTESDQAKIDNFERLKAERAKRRPLNTSKISSFKGFI